jgi:hypothetical protein
MINNRMTGIVTATIPNNQSCAGCQQINQMTFALITPLSTD